MVFCGKICACEIVFVPLRPNLLCAHVYGVYIRVYEEKKKSKKYIMTQEEKVKYWLDIAEYDIETAEAMYVTRRWLYVAFMCHQVIEKTLKAYWSAKREDIPPYIHNHKRLAEGCGLYELLDEDQKDFINTISTFNIQARYPEYKAQLAQVLTESTCRHIIDKTKELQQWIKQKL